jgi:signal transduction histidine kinase
MGEFSAEAAKVLRIAQKNCDRLGRIINDVLDIQKIEAGRMEFEFVLLDLESLLAESVDAIRPYGDRLGVRFVTESSAPGVRVRVDSDRLSQVMDNLLSNAAKFSPPGEIVRVSLSHRRGRLWVSVEDRGPGIATEFRSRLFEKFSQGGVKAARDASGTGLGLNIARAIVERLGGNIAFRPRPGGGAIFSFDLPEGNDSPAEE